MSEEEKEAIDILKRTIKNSNYCDSIGIGQIEIVLNYIDKLQKEIEEYQELTDNLRGENAELRDDLDKLQKELKDSINARFELQRRIDKLQKENEVLKEVHKEFATLCRKLKTDDTLMSAKSVMEKVVSKDKIKEALGDKNIPDEMILTYIETLVSENNRLEDIEDRKVQIEYNNVFNKGVKSVEDKIRTKIKELEKTKNYIISMYAIGILEELLGDDEQ